VSNVARARSSKSLRKPIGVASAARTGGIEEYPCLAKRKKLEIWEMLGR